LPAGTTGVELLGEMQRAHVLNGPSIAEPFYRDLLTRQVLALDLAYGSAQKRSLHLRLNKAALDLYASWVHDIGRKLPDSVLKATQRLLSAVEWLSHALQDGELDDEALRSGLQAHIAVLSRGQQSHDVAALIWDEIQRDAEMRYLVRRRLGAQGLDTVHRWLSSPP
jgi:hypothetical protein